MFESTLDSLNSFRDALGLKRSISGQGTFRGVAFLVLNEQKQSGGRRIVKREYPLRDTGGANDLGRKLRERTFTVCLIGKDTQAQTDALIEALDAAGAGELTHPDFGTVTVLVESWEYRRKADESNYCEFTITVYPAATDNAPEAGQDTASAVSSQKDSLFGSLGDTLSDAWETVQEGMDDAEAVLDAATGIVDDIYDAVENLGVLQDVNELLGALSELKGSVIGLINQPGILGASVLGALSGLSNIADASSAWRAFSRLSTHLNTRQAGIDTRFQSPAAVNNITALFHVATSAASASQAEAASGILTQAIGVSQVTPVSQAPVLTADTVSGSSVSRPAEASQSDTIIPDRDSAGVVSDSEHTPVTPLFESVTDIERVAATLGEQMDTLALHAATSGFAADSRSMTRLRLLTVNDLHTRGLRLPDVVTVTPSRTEPALVTLYRVTGNSRQWQRLARRNGVTNPLFVPGGVESEVIDE